MPLEWIDYQEAVRLIALDQVSYSLGRTCIAFAVASTPSPGSKAPSKSTPSSPAGGTIRTPTFFPATNAPLSNKALFRRDQSLCLYCGLQFPNFMLSRDHVKPLSQGGTDKWANVVTACKRCNNHKAGRTPEQASMELLAIPFTPTHAEYIYLQGRRILPTRWSSCWRISRATVCCGSAWSKVRSYWPRRVR